MAAVGSYSVRPALPSTGETIAHTADRILEALKLSNLLAWANTTRHLQTQPSLTILKVSTSSGMHTDACRH